MAVDSTKQIEKFKDFIEVAQKKRLYEIVKKGESHLLVDFSELLQYDHELADELLEEPEETIKAAEVAISFLDLPSDVLRRIRFRNLPESQKIFIKNIRSSHINNFVIVEGIVRQSSDVRPQVTLAKFECPSCGNSISIPQLDTKFKEPSRCSCGRRGKFRLLSKDLVDVQRLIIEESPESLEGGEQSKRMAVFIKEDLVEPRMEKKTTPGTKIRVYGVIKEVPLISKTGGQSTRYDLMIDCNYIEPIEEAFEEIDISEEDERSIEELSKDPLVYDKLINSIAPSIYGHQDVKEALILQLFGGVKKVKEDGTKTRGDLHILLVGDPGTGKSAVLQFIIKIAPKGRFISGKGSSAAGITAAIVKDEFLRGWALEAGAMVLANKGIAVIDELDKMSPEDRSALHEAMEQQCYHPDFNLMFTDHTKVKIGKFVDSLMEKYSKEIQRGINCEILPLKEKISLFTTDFQSIYPTTINKVSRHEAPSKFVKISLANGKVITVTSEHPCWTFKDGKITTVPAESLKENEFFPIPGNLPISGEKQHFVDTAIENGSQLCKLIGYHITDGCYELNRGKKNGIQFWNNNQMLIQDYSNAVKEVFCIKPGLTKRKEQFAVRVVSKKVVNFLNSLDGNLMERGYLKKIPEKIMQCKNEDLAFLLRALFDGDGTVVNVKRNGCRVTLAAENIELAEQVTELLLRFGILSSIYGDRNIFKIDITGQENLLKFYQNIGFLSEKKQNRLKEYLRSPKTYRSISDIVPNSSELIKRIFKQLRINERKYLGNQICMGFHKHRLFLQKMINIAEEKVGRLIEAEKNTKKTLSSEDLGVIRRNLELSTRSISAKLSLTSYMLIRNEKLNTKNERYREVLLEEIKSMLSILLELRELKKIVFGKIRWSKIKSVEFINNTNIKWVYDVTVEPNHAFVSQGMILHNSITINKANVQAQLRAETTVLAAANPKLGRFDPYQPIASQIDLPPTLINRFDLIFPIRDLPNKEKDDRIATHVLAMHKSPTSQESPIDAKLLKKYLSYSRQRLFPKLSNVAIEEIKEFYVSLRNSGQGEEGIKAIPISARQLEALVRLSEASARARLSEIVTREDAQRAIRLLKYCLMQVGFDYETGRIDIDRIYTGITAATRSKIAIIRDIINEIEGKGNKTISIDEIIGEGTKRGIDSNSVEEAVDRMKKEGLIFEPKRGFIQKI